MNIDALYCFWILFGTTLHVSQRTFGLYSLQHGVDYYAEVHTSFWNSLIHTIFMPCTMFGMYLWIPALFRMRPYEAKQLRYAVSMAYMFHYVKINAITAYFVALWYYKPLVYADEMYRRIFNPKESLCLGLAISICALFIQEVIGHYIGGDNPSRLEAIPNAMIYAPYYSVSHLVDQFVTCWTMLLKN